MKKTKHQNFSAIKEKLCKAELLSGEQVQALKFKDVYELVAFMHKTAEQAIQTSLTEYKFSPLSRGFQTQTSHNPSLGFVIKKLVDFGDRPKKASIDDFVVAQKCGGGLVTPFVFLKSGTETYGIAAKKVAVVDAEYVQSQGNCFVDSLLNLYEKQIKQGFFDCDLILGNYGYDDGALVNLDFGWSKNLWDDKTYVPSKDLHWDAFHMGVHKFRETANQLEIILPGTGDYLLEQVAERFGISFDDVTINCPRRSAAFVPLAQKLRNTVKNLRGENMTPVYPLVGEPVNAAVYAALESRL